MKKRAFTIICLLFFSNAFLSSSLLSFKTYVPPERKKIKENVYEYIESPLYEGEEAGAFNPELGTPEAAVAKFMSSKARGDEAWKEALIPEYEWFERLRWKLETWAEWKVLKWQLREIQFNSQRSVYLTVFMEIEYKGETDSGEDEFELTLKNGKWLILTPPT
ncbi:MAG: hypothetical protein JXB26_15005 [Candidatus Aminicenantes bacterium]|nr:hypothetical protein [Candidatus Aminicenantes bacterium]